jgi:hypothetical protein
MLVERFCSGHYGETWMMDCYGCTLTENRWLCPFHRRLYTFTLQGGMVRRRLGMPSIFHLKVLGRDDEIRAVFTRDAEAALRDADNR